MAGTPAYPQDWAARFASLEQRLNALAAAAQSRVAYTGGTLPGDLTVQGQFTGALAAFASDVTIGGNCDITGGTALGGGLDVTGPAAISGTLTVGGVTVTAALLALLINPPFALLTRNATQSIADGTLTAATWTGSTVSSHGGAGAGGYTAPVDGYYDLTDSTPWAPDPDGRREAAFRVNGVVYEGDSRHSSANTKLVNSLAGMFAMTAGQLAEVMVFQTAGNALNVAAGAHFEARWRRPL